MRALSSLRIAADGGETVGANAMKSAVAETPRHVFDIRIQPAVLMHHQNAGQLPGLGGRRISFDLPLPCGEGRYRIGLDAASSLGTCCAHA